MRLLEHEAKAILSRYGVAVPRGRLAKTPEEASTAAAELGRVVVKAQVPAGGRGLAGGVKFAKTPEEAAAAASQVLSMSIGGFRVGEVLVEEAVCVSRELYLSLTVDRGSRSLLFLASKAGGVEIEEIVKKHPGLLLKIPVDPLVGYSQYMSRTAATFLEIPADLWGELDKIMGAMFRVMLDYDAELVEINPLALTCDGRLVALDAKLLVDDNSLFKHPELSPLKLRELSEEERRARERGFVYVALDGDVGVIGNGAGLTMATMDLISHYGGRPANFLDVWSGGGASSERVRDALKMLLENPRVRVVLVNIFGGMTRCDEVARGILMALQESGAKKPVVVRLVGTNQEEGAKILESAGIRVFVDIDEAVKKAVELRG